MKKLEALFQEQGNKNKHGDKGISRLERFVESGLMELDKDTEFIVVKDFTYNPRDDEIEFHAGEAIGLAPTMMRGVYQMSCGGKIIKIPERDFAAMIRDKQIRVKAQEENMGVDRLEKVLEDIPVPTQQSGGDGRLAPEDSFVVIKLPSERLFKMEPDFDLADFEDGVSSTARSLAQHTGTVGSGTGVIKIQWAVKPENVARFISLVKRSPGWGLVQKYGAVIETIK